MGSTTKIEVVSLAMALLAAIGCGDGRGGRGGGAGGEGDWGGGGNGSAGSACADTVYRYSVLAAECGWGESPTRSDAEEVCGADYAWGDCVEQTAAAADCLEDSPCDAETCVGTFDTLTLCLEGAQDACAWPNDGECDEPEGTNLCGEGTDAADCGGGGGGSLSACDPASCSGSDTECTEFGCMTCWYSCNGDTCDSSCSDPY